MPELPKKRVVYAEVKADRGCGLVRLPQETLLAAGWPPGGAVEVSVEQERVVLSPIVFVRARPEDER